jgi:glycosyltransferase involved in cell wall biosynthesis
VIYQGCQAVFKKIYTTKQKLAVQQRYNLPQQFILNVGTIEERKNVLCAVKALVHVDTTLVIIGKETKYTVEVKKFIDEHQIKHKVLFLSGLTSEELAIVYQLATVFVYPSLFEGFGIPIIEALYSSTPVITNKFGVFPEAGGPDTIYIDPSKEEEMALAIQKLLNDSALCDSIAAKGLQFVQKFNDAVLAEQLIATYEKVIQDKV